MVQYGCFERSGLAALQQMLNAKFEAVARITDIIDQEYFLLS